MGPYATGLMLSSPPLDDRGTFASGNHSPERNHASSSRTAGPGVAKTRPVEPARRQAKPAPPERAVPRGRLHHPVAPVDDEEPALEDPVQIHPKADPGPDVVRLAPIRDVRGLKGRRHVAPGERAPGLVGREHRPPERHLTRARRAFGTLRPGERGVKGRALRAEPARHLARVRAAAEAVLGERGGDPLDIPRIDGIAKAHATPRCLPRATWPARR